MKLKIMKTLGILGVLSTASLVHATVSTEMGRGFQTFDKDEVKKDRCIVVDDSKVQTESNTQTKYTLDLINNKEELRDKIVITSSNGGSYGSFNAQAKMKFVKEVNWNYNSIYILVRAERVTKTQTLNTNNILLSENARKILLESKTKFLDSCGNRFINKVNYGGEIYGLVEIQNRTLQEKQTLEISLSASGKYGGAKGSTSNDYKREIEKITSQYKAKISFEHTGGEHVKVPQDAAGLLDVSSRIEELTDQFPEAVSVESRDYNSVSNYDVNSNDSYETKIRQNEIEWAEGKLKQARNLYAQILYVLQNPKDFKDVDEAELKKNLKYLDEKIIELKNFTARATSFLNDVDHNDIELDLDINVPAQKRRAAKKELKFICTNKESSICGVRTYKKQVSPACEPIGPKEGTGEVCGTNYKDAADKYCGVKSFKLAAAPVCGVLRYKQCHTRSCGKNYNGSRKRCRASACGVEAYNSCRDESNGVEEYNSCRDSHHEIESYKTCKDKSFGYEFNSCEHISHGPATYNSCDVTKIGTQESICPEF